MVLNNKQQLEELFYEHLGFPMRENFASLIANNCRNLVEFIANISDEGFVMHHLVDLIRVNPRLNSLELQQDLDYMVSTVFYKRETAHLAVDNSYIAHGSETQHELQANLVCQLLSAIPKLNSFYLGGGWEITCINDSVLKTIAGRFTELTTLWCDGVCLDDCSADSWSELLTNCKLLDKAEFYQSTEVSSFARAMTVTQNKISSLVVSECKSLTEDILFELIRANIQLTDINIQDCEPVRYEAIKRFISGLNRPALDLAEDFYGDNNGAESE